MSDFTRFFHFIFSLILILDTQYIDIQIIITIMMFFNEKYYNSKAFYVLCCKRLFYENRFDNVFYDFLVVKR